MKPIIGVISTANHDLDYDRQFLARFEIVEWISKCGGIPISILPTKTCDYYDVQEKNRKYTVQELNDLKQILQMCDGFIKPGGNEILDYHKLIYSYSIVHNIPYLGICAGMQVMAQELERANIVGNESTIIHKTDSLNAHDIIINEQSKLYSILGKKSIVVNSRHNYHVELEELKRLLISATSLDNQIEALEHPDCTYNIGLQWHPESYDYNNQDSKNIF